MNIRDLEYVVALADEGHFGRAARACNVSQPALSGQIRKLEDRLGVRLFERSNRSVRITPVGDQVVARARALLALSDEIVSLAQAARDPLSGPFRLGMIATIGPYLAPLILSPLHRAMSKLELSLVEGLTGDLEAQLAAGQLDAVIQATRPVLPNLAIRPLYAEPFFVALPRTHRLAGHDRVRLDEIAPDELLLLADGHCLRDQVLSVCGASAGRANTRETSLETLLALVAAGDGVTLLPALVQPRASQDVVLRPEANGAAGRLVCLVARDGYARPQVLDVLAHVVREALADLVPVGQGMPGLDLSVG